MALICPITKKKAQRGNNRSHALNATRRTWKINFQKVTVMINNKPQVIKVSARGLRSIKNKGKILV